MRSLIRTLSSRMIALAMLALSPAGIAHADTSPVEVRSPDSTIRIVVASSSGTAPPTYTVERRGEVIVASSRLGLQLRYSRNFGPFDIAGVVRHSVDQRYALIATKAATARDHYNEVTVSLVERNGEQRAIDLIVRAYDDGVAFRYRLARQPGTVSIVNELTEFVFPADYDCWGLNLGRTDTPHEGRFDPVKASDMRFTQLFDAPVACRTRSTAFLLAEADLDDYAAMYLTGRVEGGLGMQVALSPRWDDRKIAVRRDLSGAGLLTPWRVVMMADRAGDLIASNLIANLNPPSKLADHSWIVPGKSAWDWWSDPYAANTGVPRVDPATIRRFIDFAAASGFPYMLIDEGWAVHIPESPGHPDPGNSDILNAKPGIDMPALVRYAADRHVGLMLWVRWNTLDPQIDAAFDLYRRWGIKGVKIDFMDRDDQEMVGFYHRVVSSAAAHHLLVDLHGAYHPTGLNRTWPNFITQEGVMGAEWNKWSTWVTARHNVTLPYTRMALGPMDYTPGGFGNTPPPAFDPRMTRPTVQTTRGQALAMYIVYDSPLQMVSDEPAAYAEPDAAGFDFVREVPTTWDEVRFISGEIGQSVVLARRKGRDWYVGAMTNEVGRNIEVPLAFLGAGRFTATSWTDGATPMMVTKAQRSSLRARDVLTLELAPMGGAVVKLTAE